MGRAVYAHGLGVESVLDPVQEGSQVHVVGASLTDVSVLSEKGSPALDPLRDSESVTMAILKNGFSTSIFSLGHEAPET